MVESIGYNKSSRVLRLHSHGTNLASHDDNYRRISKKDEGNIGGTLSNAQLKSGIEEQKEIMQLSEALIQDGEPEIALRIDPYQPPMTTNSPVRADFRDRMAPKLNNVPISSYHKVSLTSQKARLRQSVLGYNSNQSEAFALSSPQMLA